MTTPAGAVASNARETERQAGGSGNVFSKKYGPLPGWGWAALAGGSALVYFWWKKRQAQQASTTTATTASTGAAYTGFTSASVATLQSEIQQLQGQAAASSKTTTGTGATTSGSTPPGGTGSAGGTGPTTGKTTTPPPPTVLVTVPKVTGEQANFAIGNLESAGLTWKESSPPRNPRYTYITVSQSPAAGTKVPKGSVVTVAFQQHTFPGE